ncbi:MAG: helix-turn-helix domain-containing protein [Candidatus Nanohaloarchaea archaeon]|nr:helix-turn-helix domain-containing protein [Candidatus Nanohaloarchaea archaeon]
MSFINLDEPEEIVFEALGLNDLQREIYDSLQDNELAVKDLVEKTGRTRSVVQRALQEMLNQGIVAREAMTDKTIYYVYTSVPFDKIKDKVADLIDKWHRKVQKKLS